MSQVEDDGEKNGPRENPQGTQTVHRTLQETADMHGISKSHLSRCVRQKKAAKGYDLRPYAQLKKKSDGTERILGFKFPVGYEPEDGKRNDSPRRRDPEGNSSDGKPPEEKTSEEMARPAHEGFSPQAGAAETAGNRQETDAPTENASGGPTAGAGEAQDLEKALAKERARRKEAEEAAARAQEEKEKWKELAQSREEDLRHGIRGLSEVVNQLEAKINQQEGELGENQRAITDLQGEFTELRKSVYERIRDEADTRRDAIDELHDRIAGAAKKRRDGFESLRDEFEEIAEREEEKRRKAIEAIETRLESRFGDLEERVEDLRGGVLESLSEKLGEIGQGLQKAAKENPERAAEVANQLINLVVACVAPQLIAEGPPAQTGLQQNDPQREQSAPNIGYGELLAKQAREEETSSSEESSPEDSSEASPDGEDS
jgi:hypothetical protein